MDNLGPSVISPIHCHCVKVVVSKNDGKGVEGECGKSAKRIKIIGRLVKNSAGGEVSGGKEVEISG